MASRTKIIATVGPASGSCDKLRALVEAGVDVFRINFSHGSEGQRAEFLANIRKVERQADRPVAVCGDLCGPKIRVGMIRGGEVRLEAEGEVTVQRAPLEGDATRISTTLPELVDVVRQDERILLADGRLELQVVALNPPEQFTCRVVMGGVLSSGKGVNLPETDLSTSPLTEKDRRDIQWLAPRQFDFVALSFVRDADDVKELRRLLDQHGSTAHIIAKVEKPQALQQIDAIIQTADAVMVARGDLGVEMDYPTVPIAQKLIAQKCQAAGKPCIIATEMLESMIQSSRPTRAEVSDVANAVFDQADAVMLSAESAIGKYPIDAVIAMNRTVQAAEAFLDERSAGPQQVTTSEPQTTAALAASIRKIMQMQKVAAIVVFTASGTTARLISKNRPACPILALSGDVATVRRAGLYYGVIARKRQAPESVHDLLDQSIQLAKQMNVAKPGDQLVVMAGHPIGVQGRTNTLIVETVT